MPKLLIRQQVARQSSRNPPVVTVRLPLVTVLARVARVNPKVKVLGLTSASLPKTVFLKTTLSLMTHRVIRQFKTPNITPSP